MKLLRVGLVSLGLVSIFVGQAIADVTPAAVQPGALALTPAIQDRVLGSSETSVSFSVQLSNQTDKPVTFALSSTDFTALNQTGGLAFLGADSRRVGNGHGLSGILELDSESVVIPANSSQQVTARIPDVSKLSPGGHYGAILAQALPSDSQASGNKVAINQVLSSLLFVETAGQGTKTLQLLSPQISSVSFALPTNLNLVFKATGNTQTIPRGEVTISRGDREVLHGIINQNSSLLLPGSTRLLLTELTGDRRPVLPGFYKLSVRYRYEGSLGTTVYQKRLLYVNLQAIVLALVGLILLPVSLLQIRRFWRRRQRRRQRAKKTAVTEEMNL